MTDSPAPQPPAGPPQGPPAWSGQPAAPSAPDGWGPPPASSPWAAPTPTPAGSPPPAAPPGPPAAAPVGPPAAAGYPPAQPGPAGYPPAHPVPTGYPPAQPGPTGYPPPGAGYPPASPPPGHLPPPNAPGPGMAPPADYGYGAPPVQQLETVVRKGSRGGRIAAAAIGVVALVGGGAFAVTALRSSASGASSPQAAVDELFTAVNNEDVIGVLNALPKGEREAFVPFAQDTLAEMKRLGLVDGGTDLGKVGGVDVEFTGYTTSVVDVADTVANVKVSGGTMKAGYDMSQLPMGDLLIDTFFDGERPQGAATTSSPNTDDLEVTTVKDDDGWHVSLWYSLAENARQGAGMPAPNFGHGVPAVGADTPEGAVTALVDALSTLDVERMIELSPPSEAAALHDYAPLFLDDAKDAVDQLFDDSGLELDVALTGLASEGSGDRRVVTFTGVEGTATVGGETVEFSYEDGCWSVTPPDGTHVAGCVADTLADADLTPEQTDSVERIVDRGIRIVVTEEDGKWYVSPFGTVTETWLTLLRAVERADIEKLSEGAGQLLDEGVSDLPFGGPLNGFGLGGPGSGSSAGNHTSLTPTTVSSSFGGASTPRMCAAWSSCGSTRRAPTRSGWWRWLTPTTASSRTSTPATSVPTWSTRPSSNPSAGGRGPTPPT